MNSQELFNDLDKACDEIDGWIAIHQERRIEREKKLRVIESLSTQVRGYDFAIEYCQRIEKMIDRDHEYRPYAIIGTLQATLGIILSEVQHSDPYVYAKLLIHLNNLNPKSE